MSRPKAVGGAYGLCPRRWAGPIDFASGYGRGLLTLPDVMGGASIIRPRGFACLIPDGAFLF